MTAVQKIKDQGLYIFVSNTDNGIECALRKFANDTKWCGAVDTLEGKDAVQRELDKLERWANTNIMKFNKVKHKVLHMGYGNSRHTCRLDEVTESSQTEKDLGEMVDEKSQHGLTMCAHSPENQTKSWAAPQRVWLAGWRR
ncbi:rna-directed dna polymerase from mobile element jockey-like [Willisornis vidua]|uniref:Rna-directed dna polymerase from mobile element jockey-like n=1 Tax=Willisornis vidua TaxID=1566151 RepID=A0ABQ9CPE4_9PASS|nr:rna-directed dna polymerase from mobile element jockey-like [Willisornis vidua]